MPTCCASSQEENLTFTLATSWIPFNLTQPLGSKLQYIQTGLNMQKKNPLRPSTRFVMQLEERDGERLGEGPPGADVAHVRLTAPCL